MTRRESTLSITPAGAGRFLDAIWPSPNQYQINAPMMLRNNASVTPRVPTFVAFGAGALSGAGVRNGVPVYAVQSAVGGGNAVILTSAPVLMYTTKNAIDGNTNDMQCWRIIFRSAMFAAPAAPANEAGLYLTADPAHPQIVTDANFGFGFRFLSTGGCSFVAIAGGAATTTPLLTVAGGYDLTVLHTYELRIVSATPNSDAFLQIFFDGADLTPLLPATSSSWAAGTVLPLMGSAANIPGFAPTLVNNANNVNAVYCNQLRCIAAPLYAALF